MMVGTQYFLQRFPHLRSIAFLTAFLLFVFLTGCASGGGNSEKEDADTQAVVGKSLVKLAVLNIPQNAHVEPKSIKLVSMSQDGSVVVGEALQQQSQNMNAMQAFHWNVVSGEWQWIEGNNGQKMFSPVGVSASGALVFGSQWFWYAQTHEWKSLPADFWAYAATDKALFIGTALGMKIATYEGNQKENFALSQLDISAADQAEYEWLFSRSGTVVGHTLNACARDGECTTAQLLWWDALTGKSGRGIVQQTTPTGALERHKEGTQVISDNGKWLTGFLDTTLYRWSTEGESLLMGGFPNGGKVFSVSDDGLMSIGQTVTETGVRSWIWTQTEGLGWLDEWLRNHAVNAAWLSPQMQGQLLSADRRVLIGMTPAKEVGEAPLWWRVDLAENLRVLM